MESYDDREHQLLGLSTFSIYVDINVRTQQDVLDYISLCANEAIIHLDLYKHLDMNNVMDIFGLDRTTGLEPDGDKIGWLPTKEVF